MSPDPAHAASAHVVDDILKNATAAIFVMDAANRCTYMNPAAEVLTGFTGEQLRDRVLHDVIHHSRRDGSAYPIGECPIGCSLLDGEHARGEEVFVHRDGTFYDVAYAASLIRRDGEVAGAVLEVRDITETVRTQNALRETDRRKDEFLAMLAHELRNPLAPINTAAQLLLRSEHDPVLVHDASTVIARQVKYMVGLVDDLLDVSRVTRGHVQLELRTVDLRHALRAALEQVRPEMEQRGHALAVALPDEALWVSGDAKRLVQVATNLLHNAAKYTASGGAIELRAGRRDGSVLLEVTDNGLGIAPELLPHVFDLFTQGARSLGRSQGGLGIGLALVRSLVVRQGGTVRAHSAGEGRGSRFTVTLPAVDAPLPESPAAVGERREGGSSEAAGLRIALVDDNVDALRMMSRMLLSRGHRVDTYPTASAALAAARLHRYDAYLLDIGLPDRSGYDLARELRQLPGARAAALLALTGYGQADDVAAATDAGFDAHFVKPVDPDVLLRTLARIGRTGAPAELADR